MRLRGKIFISLLVSFLIMSGANIYADYYNELYHCYDTLSMQTPLSIAYSMGQLFQDNYENMNEDYFYELKKNYPDIHFMIYDRDENVVFNSLEYDYDEEQNKVIPYPTRMDVLDLETQSGIFDAKPYHIDLSSLSQEQIHNIDSYLNIHKYDGHIDVSIAIENNDESVFEDDKVIQVCYLQVGSQLIFDHRQNNEAILGAQLYNYTSAYFYLRCSYVRSDSTLYNDSSLSMDYHTIVDNIDFHIYNEGDGEFVSLSSIDDRYQNDKTLYQIYGEPLIKKGAVTNVNGNYYSDDILGYVVTWDFDYQATSRIFKEILIDKIYVYLLSFWIAFYMSLFLSHIFTRRIKKIDESTQKIANNQFDIYLDERSQDELGTLSHSINVMSQKLKETIEELQYELEHVKKLESVRKEFIANFTHEIKTPLGIMNGYIELINEVDDHQKKEEYLNAIVQEIQHVNQLVLAMLKLTRLESGKVELHKESIDLDDLVTSCLDNYAMLLKKKQIQVRIEGEAPIIEADPFEIQIVINNFLSNAIKHTPMQKMVRIIYQDNMIKIENEGQHISDQQKEMIWETYVSSDREGTGLGLAICKSILELHGFEYGVENTDRGVCFYFVVKK